MFLETIIFLGLGIGKEVELTKRVVSGAVCWRCSGCRCIESRVWSCVDHQLDRWTPSRPPEAVLRTNC